MCSPGKMFPARFRDEQFWRNNIDHFQEPFRSIWIIQLLFQNYVCRRLKNHNSSVIYCLTLFWILSLKT